MSRSLILLLALVAPAWTPTASAEPVACATLPGNLAVPAIYLAHVQQLIAQSPTLRRQCLVIAAAPGVTVAIRPAAGRLTANCRARTEFTRTRAGVLRAVVDLPVSRDFTELLAHELEHVIEQIEGIDLARLAGRAGSGVWTTGPNVFETARAMSVGRHAAREGRRCVDPFGAACGQAPVVLASND